MNKKTFYQCTILFSFIDDEESLLFSKRNVSKHMDMHVSRLWINLIEMNKWNESNCKTHYSWHNVSLSLKMNTKYYSMKQFFNQKYEHLVINDFIKQSWTFFESFSLGSFKFSRRVETFKKKCWTLINPPVVYWTATQIPYKLYFVSLSFHWLALWDHACMRLLRTS